MARRSPGPQPERTPEEWADLRRRGESGDAEAIFVLNYLHHDIDDLVIDDGDLGARAEQEVIALAATGVPEQAALARHLAQMRTELDGPTPNPIERLLVDRVVTCWVHLTYLDGRCARSYRGDSIANQKLLEHLLDGANRRYLTAAKTLAQVRRLIVPVVQLNMANQQVNVVVGSSDG